MSIFAPPLPAFQLVNVLGIVAAIIALVVMLAAAVWYRRAKRAVNAAKAQGRDYAACLEREIAERGRVENAWRRSEEQMRLLVESAIDYAIFTVDLKGVITSWNTGAERLLGYSEQEILGRDGSIIYTDEDRAAGQPDREMTLALNHGRAEDERWHQRKDGRRFWGSGLVMPLRDPEGTIQGLVKIMRDQTARRQAETSMRDSEERYRRLTELSPDPVVVVMHERVQYANAAALRLVGATTADQFIGREMADLVHPDAMPAMRDRIKRLLRTGKMPPIDDQILFRLDGAAVHVEALAALVPWEGRTAVQFILHDLTERKRIEDSLRQASEMHRLLLRELDHRVRNNLASLVSLIEISAGGKTNIGDYAQAIRHRVQAMVAVHQLLSKQRWTTVNLADLIQAIRPASGPGTLRATGPDVPIASRQVTALGMVLQELFSNSVKYGAMAVPGGLVKIDWRVDDDDDEATERTLEMTWTERNAPPLLEREPTQGVGSGLIKGFARSELRGEARLSYPREGATHRLQMRLDPIRRIAEMAA